MALPQNAEAFFKRPIQIRALALFVGIFAALSVCCGGEPVKVDVISSFYNPNQPEAFPHLIQMTREDPG